VPSGDSFVIRNVGSSKPITVGNRTLPIGGIAQLEHGLKVSIGAYVLEVDALGQSQAQTAKVGTSDPASAGPEPAGASAQVEPAVARADAGPTASGPLDHGSAHVGPPATSDADTTQLLGRPDSPMQQDLYAQQLWAAFCEGAGIQLPLPAGAGTERMRHVGSLLRIAVDGTLRMMSVRSRTKAELGSDVTVIRRQDNNPLKFSPDASVGLSHLLQTPVQGFVPGLTAMEDAMKDLVAHAEGSWAGMRAAIDSTVEQLSPEALEARSFKGLALGTLLPVTRKAKLWDAYRVHHLQVQDQAQHDLPSLCGKAFSVAYDKALEQQDSEGRD
jgi:FHA domain-containing protein